MEYAPDVNTKTELRPGDAVTDNGGMKIPWTIFAINAQGRALIYSTEGNVTVMHVHWLEKVAT